MLRCTVRQRWAKLVCRFSILGMCVKNEYEEINLKLVPGRLHLFGQPTPILFLLPGHVISSVVYQMATPHCPQTKIQVSSFSENYLRLGI